MKWRVVLNFNKNLRYVWVRLCTAPVSFFAQHLFRHSHFVCLLGEGFIIRQSDK